MKCTKCKETECKHENIVYCELCKNAECQDCGKIWVDNSWKTVSSDTVIIPHTYPYYTYTAEPQ